MHYLGYTEKQLLNKLNISKSYLIKIKKNNLFGVIHKGKSYYTENELNQIYNIAYSKRIGKMKKVRTTLKILQPISSNDLYLHCKESMGKELFFNLLADLTYYDTNIWEDDSGFLHYGY